MLSKCFDFGDDDILYALRSDGIGRIGSGFDPDPVLDYLSTKTVYNAHVKAKARGQAPYATAISQQPWPMFCWPMEDIVTAPNVFEVALSLAPLARAYFDETPNLYSMNVFATQPSKGPQYQDTHWWHRDTDDRKQLVAFFMLSDVPTPADGAHRFRRGSHNKTNAELGCPDVGAPPEQPEDEVETVVGLAGDIFLVDTRGFHMAYRPQYRARILAWARFGVSDPPVSYGWDELRPVPKALMGSRYPADPELQRLIHLVCV